jgi:hypothetical protein
MNNQERYHYTKLTNPDSFRLILLEPSPTLTAPLQCSLLFSTLLDYDEDIIDYYTALSYVWGNANDKGTISIDGKYFLEITATLEQALRYLRDARRELKVWADGICINQNDFEEKNVQVGLMGSIYKLARHTIIFLGEETPESKVVMNAVCPPRANFVGTPGLLLNFLGMQDDDQNAELTHAPTLSKEILELAEKHILQRPWFNRVWVLQELVLSTDPWIQIGPRRVRWNVFSGRLLSSSKESSTDIQSGVKHLSRMEDARRLFGDSLFRGVKFAEDEFNTGTFSGDLLKIIHTRRGAGVTDPRDMIFAHLGIMGVHSQDDGLRKFIKVDYRRSIAELYADVARYFMDSRNAFAVLSHVEDVAIEQRRAGLPTWVPDWASASVSSEAENQLEGPHYTWKYAFHGVFKFPTGTVLACNGNPVAVIDDILESRPPKVDVEAMFRELNPDVSGNKGSPNEDAEYVMAKAAYFILHDKLRNWLGETNLRPFREQDLIGDGIMDESEASQMEFLEDTGYIFALRRLEKFLGRPIMLPQDVRLGYEGLERARKANQAAGVPNSLVQYLIVWMMEKDDNERFPGRTVAILKKAPGALSMPLKNLAMVPRHSRVGDYVCHFGRSDSRTPFILRKLQDSTSTEIMSQLPAGLERVDHATLPDAGMHSNESPNRERENQEIQEYFAKHPQPQRSSEDYHQGWQTMRPPEMGPLEQHPLVYLDTSRIEHYNFVGEGLLSYWGFPEVPISEEFISSHNQIVVLH